MDLYPDIRDPKFNQKLIDKPEFAMHFVPPIKPVTSLEAFKEVTANKCQQREFELNLQQSFISHYLSHVTPYTGLLLFHGVGTGKSCAAISVAEEYLNSTKQENVKNRVIVLASDALKANFKKELFDMTKLMYRDSRLDREMAAKQCTGDRYLSLIPLEKLDGVENAKKLKHTIKSVIKSRYDFMGYGRFVKRVEEILAKKNGDSILKRTFSNSIIIVDEAHNIRKSHAEGKKIGERLQKVLQHVENCKLLLLTATPMYNSVKEIVFLINLLRQNDKQDLLPEWEDTPEYLNRLTSAARGYCSFMRSENPYIFPIRLYNQESRVTKYPGLDIYNQPLKFTLKQITVSGCPMSRFQEAAYFKFMSGLTTTEFNKDLDKDLNEDDNENADEDKESQSLLRGVQISNIAYPNTKYQTGEKGFGGCLTSTGIGFRYQTNERFLELDKIGKYSSKFEAILKNISLVDKPVMIYSEYIYGGVLPLALALEHLGYRRYGAPNLLSNEYTKDLKLAAGKRQKTYLILTSNSKYTKNIADSVVAINQNLVDVVLLTRVASEGISFSNIREVHILEPWYHINKLEQVIGRATRTCSHIGLPVEERNVTIYQYAATLAATKTQTTQTTQTKETSDLYMYRLADSKIAQIKVVEDRLQKSAIDCRLFEHMTRFPKELFKFKFQLKTARGTSIDYQLGNDNAKGTCDANFIENSKKSENSNNVNFTKIHYGHLIPIVQRQIVKLFLTEHKIPLSKIVAGLSTYYPAVIYDALTDLVYKNQIVYDNGDYYLPPHVSIPPRKRFEIIQNDEPSTQPDEHSEKQEKQENKDVWAAFSQIPKDTKTADFELEYAVHTMDYLQFQSVVKRLIIIKMGGDVFTEVEKRVYDIMNYGIFIGNGYIDYFSITPSAFSFVKRNNLIQVLELSATKEIASATKAAYERSAELIRLPMYGLLGVYRPTKKALQSLAVPIIKFKTVADNNQIAYPKGKIKNNKGAVCKEASHFGIDHWQKVLSDMNGFQPSQKTITKQKLCDCLARTLLHRGHCLRPLETALLSY